MYKISGDTMAHYRAREQLDIKNRAFSFPRQEHWGDLKCVFFSDTNDVAETNREIRRNDV